MSSKWMLAALLVVSVVGVTGCKKAPVVPQAAGVSGTMPVMILDQMQGNDPGLTAPDVLIIKSMDELAATGSQELVTQKIDFEKYTLVVLALGTQNTGGYAAIITGIQVEGDTLFVQGRALRPTPDAMVTQVITYPYAAALIPATQATRVKAEIQSAVAGGEGM